MNWYKKSQQQTLFYPFGQNPGESTQKIPPLFVDPKTQQNVYKCHICEKLILEEEIAKWYKDIEGVGENLQLPQYDKGRISQALTEIAQYLSSFLLQLYNYIKEKNLESKRNNTYDYGFRTELSRWEVQVPQLRNIMNNYPELTDICAYKNYGYGKSNICSLLNAVEISGTKLLDLEEFIKDPTDQIKFFSEYIGQEFNIKYSVPVCYDCYEEFEQCEFCQKPITPDQKKYQTVWSDTDYICENCIEDGYAEVCINCGKADNTEDMYYIEDEGNICENCYKNENDERIKWAKETISKLDIPVGKNNPISAKALNNLDEFLRRYIRKYGDEDLQDGYKKLLHVAKKSGLTLEAIYYLEVMGQSNYKVQDILNDIDDSLDAQKYMKEQYPNLKNYQNLPFDINIVKNYNESKQGFTITITPSDEFFDYAEKKYPNIKEVWEYMNDTPHHKGVLAYARCAYQGGNSLVINNLQRDADYDNYMNRRSNPGQSEIETAKWLNNQTKHWDIFLLNLVKAMAISEDISAYLTTFDQQRSKWRNLPVYKSKRTYEKVPENMGFKLNDPDNNETYGLIENGASYNEDMYQLANNRIGNWYKIAQFENLSIGEISQQYDILQKKYLEFLYRENSLSEKEKIEMKETGDRLNLAGKIYKEHLNIQRPFAEQLIQKGEAYKVNPHLFMEYHKTGNIPHGAYDKYKTKEGISWLGTPDKYPILYKKKEYDGEIIEFRKSGKKLNYVKHGEDGEILRDNNGMALYMNDEEMKEKEVNKYDTSIVAFNSQKEPIGNVSNEFGSDGVWVVKEYQGKGIGTDLLYEFRKQFKPKRKIGQMTDSGKNMTRSYHKKLVQEALKEGKDVPMEILQEYELV